MKTTLSTRGQIVLPADIRHEDKLHPGQEFDVERITAGEYRLVRVPTPTNEGLLDALMACPVKDYFVPIESESTDSL